MSISSEDSSEPNAQLPTPVSASGEEACDHAERVLARQRAADEAGWSRIAAKDHFRSPGSNRLQILSQAVAVFFPKAITPETAAAFEDMVTFAPKCPALAVAMDSACLLQLGQEDGDLRMLMAGKKLYVAALRLMANEVGRPANRRCDGGIVAAINVLQSCELYSSMGVDDSGWKCHASGLTSLMRVKMPGESSYKAILDYNFLLYYIWYGLINRQPINLVDSRDKGSITIIAQRVPGMLQECDHVLLYGHTTLPTLTVKVVQGLKAVEQNLLAWTAHWNHDGRDPPYSIVTADSLKCADATRRLFPYVFAFKDLFSAQQHATCTACLLAVRKAILDIDLMLMNSGGNKAGYKRLQSNRARLIQTTSDCADSLCMTLPYMHKADHGKYGLLNSVGPLYMARSWYQAAEASAEARSKLVWCADVAAFINDQGIRTLG